MEAYQTASRIVQHRRSIPRDDDLRKAILTRNATSNAKDYLNAQPPCVVLKRAKLTATTTATTNTTQPTLWSWFFG